MDNRIVASVLAAVLVAVGALSYNKFGDLDARVAKNSAAVAGIDKRIKDATSAFLDSEAIDKRIDQKINSALGESGVISAAIAAGIADVKNGLDNVAAVVDELDEVVNSTTAEDGLRLAISDAVNKAMVAQQAIFAKDGLAANMTKLAERHNEHTAVAAVMDAADREKVREAEQALVEARAKELKGFDLMRAAVRGQTTAQYTEAKKAKVEKKTSIVITVLGDNVKVEKVPVPALRHISPPQ